MCIIQLFGSTEGQSAETQQQLQGLDGAILWDSRLGAVFFYGTLNECFGFHLSCLGVVNEMYLAGVPTGGFLDLASGLDPTGLTFGATSTGYPTRANLLVRTVSIPEPSAMILVLCGVLALIISTSRRKQLMSPL